MSCFVFSFLFSENVNQLEECFSSFLMGIAFLVRIVQVVLY